LFNVHICASNVPTGNIMLWTKKDELLTRPEGKQ
jgi:hypothetical protein